MGNRIDQALPYLARYFIGPLFLRLLHWPYVAMMDALYNYLDLFYCSLFTEV